MTYIAEQDGMDLSTIQQVSSTKHSEFRILFYLIFLSLLGIHKTDL